MKKIYFLLLAMCLMGVACKEYENEQGKSKPEIPPVTCNIENPLTDLTWLKAKVDEINLMIQKENPLTISIYQCIYGNGEAGFLVDEGNIKPFYNCNGEKLCIMGGDAGEACSELNIVSQKLIWETEKSSENDIYGNHDISACGVNDPLQNIEWLREFCEGLNTTQDFSSVYIYLYKVIDTDEHVFKIGITYSEFEYSPFAYTEDWRSCMGKLIFGVSSGVPPVPGLLETFLKDKEYVAELFHSIKQ